MRNVQIGQPFDTAMPRYFFHVHDDLDAEDAEGLELPGIEVARVYAIMGARELMAESLKTQGRISTKHRIDIADDQGRILEGMVFGDAVTIES